MDNEDDAYLIFETLNTRGKDLSLSDLLKNHFAKLIKAKGDVDHSVYNWNLIRDIIDDSAVDLDVDTFIVHSWQSKHDFVTKGKAFKKIKSHIVKHNAKRELDEFVKDAKIWRGMYEPSYFFASNQAFDKKIRRSLEALRIFKVVQPMPGILSLLRAFSEKEIRPKVAVSGMESIEKFHFAFNAVTSSRSSGGISGMYSSLGRGVYESDTPLEIQNRVLELREKLTSRWPSNSEFDAGFEQIIFTNSHTSQKSLVRYILKKISIYLSQPFIGETDDLTIEHLLPQSEIGELGEGVIGSIGNLMLIDQTTNSKLGNRPFSEKKKILLDSGYKLSPALDDATKLDAETLLESTKYYAEIARTEVWRL